MQSLARLWYSQQKQARELQSRNTGWCGGRVPLAPWARSKAQTSGADGSNDDFFFNEPWLYGAPRSIQHLIKLDGTEGIVKMMDWPSRKGHLSSTSSQKP